MQEGKYGKHIHDDDLDQIGYDDEPVFVIRSADSAGVHAVRQYAQIVKGYNASDEHVQAVHEFADAMEAWQEANPDKVKTAD
jgi:hypothetical protein